MSLATSRLEQVKKRLLKLDLWKPSADILTDLPTTEDPWNESSAHYLSHFFVLRPDSETMGAFHYAKIPGNFGREINGTLRSLWKFSGQSGPPQKVVLFDHWVRSDRKLAFHFQKFLFPVPLFLTTQKPKWRMAMKLICTSAVFVSLGRKI